MADIKYYGPATVQALNSLMKTVSWSTNTHVYNFSKKMRLAGYQKKNANPTFLNAEEIFLKSF